MIANAETLRAGLAALFARLTTIPVALCEEEEVAKKQAGTGGLGAKLTWSITDRDTIGQDELLTYYDEDAEIPGDEYAGPGAPLGGVVYEARTNVVYLLEVRVECTKHNVGARFYLERLRNRINFPSAQAELAALGLAVASVGPAFNAGYDDETGHAVSAWVTEIELNSATTEADDPVTTIEVLETEVTPADDLPEMWISDELAAFLEGAGVVHIASPHVWANGGAADRRLDLVGTGVTAAGGPGMQWAFDERRHAWTSSWRLGHEALFMFRASDINAAEAAPRVTINTPNESKTHLQFRGGDLWGIDRGIANSRLFRYGAAQVAESSTPELIPELVVTILCGAESEATTTDFLFDDQDYIWTCNWQVSPNPNHGKQLLGLPPAQYAASGTVTPAVICQGSNFDGNPGGIAADPNGTHCWVSFWNSGEVKRFSFAALRAGGNAAPDVVFTSPAFANPWGLAVGPDGVLWVAAYNERTAVGFALSELVTSGVYAPTRTVTVPDALSVFSIAFRPRSA